MTWHEVKSYADLAPAVLAVMSDTYPRRAQRTLGRLRRAGIVETAPFRLGWRIVKGARV